MIGSWWFVWMAFMFLFLLTPVTYGWGYRGWGPPYPRYVQRRRHAAAAAAAAATRGSSQFDHQLWGRAGDFVWVVLFVAVGWAVVAGFWH